MTALTTFVISKDAAAWFEATIDTHCKKKNKLRWYPQQSQRFIFCTLEPSPEPVEPDLALHQGFLEPSPEPSLEPC